MNRFLSDENVKTLWDVVIDADIIKTKPPPIKKQISELFINNIEGFYHNEKNKCSNLVEMNKKYIMYVLSSCSNTSIKKEVNNQVIPTIQNVKQDMQSERQNKIDKDFERIQKEFESTMKLEVPPTPNFNDKLDDGPIKNIEEVLREMTAQRKYDVYNITNNQLQNVNKNWLKSEETSIKNEKEIQKKAAEDSFQEIFSSKNTNKSSSQEISSQQSSPLRYIKIENQYLDKSIINNDLIDLDNSPKKQVSWGSNQTHNIEDAVIHDTICDTPDYTTDHVTLNVVERENNAIFSKLKRKNIGTEENSNNDINTHNFQGQINILSEKIDKINENMNIILQILMKNNTP
jgi:hypothetical protein